MFQRWPYMHLFLVIVLAICASLMIGYAVPALSDIFTAMTQFLFALTGVSALFLGCMGLYATWRRGY